MVVADLHIHTQNSDGTLTLETLDTAAHAAGVTAVAITDHDCFHPALTAPLTTHNDITIIHGMELRVDSPAGRIDLLGYGVRRTDALQNLVDTIQANRIERGRQIISCVEDRLDVTLPVEPRKGIGRPHIARAIEATSEYTYQGAFDEVIGEECPCYVARDIPVFTDAVTVLNSACSLISLAHPLRYDDPQAALSLCADLDAVERYYPYETPVEPARIDAAMKRNDLLATGGSDAHTETIGGTGLGHDAYNRFRDAL